MSERLTDEQVTEIEARANAATQGPWYAKATAEFNAHARTDIPALLTDRQALLDEIAALRRLLAAQQTGGE